MQECKFERGRSTLGIIKIWIPRLVDIDVDTHRP